MKVLEPAIRFRPFSHVPGTHCLLPGSYLSCVLFPAKVLLLDKEKLVAEIVLQDFGPLSQFTVEQDLEQGNIQVGGFCESEYLRYRIYPVLEATDFGFCVLKKPAKGLFSCMQKSLDEKKEKLPMPERERLFLGCTKAQEWPLVLRRQDICEILPFWYWLSQSVPSRPNTKKTSFFKVLEEAVLQQKREEIAELLLSHYLVSFQEMAVPRWVDDSYLGIKVDELSQDPLKEGFSLIRQIFFRELPHHLFILPALPPLFHSGMLAGIRTQNNHRIHIEWTKQQARRVWIEAGNDDVVTVALQKHITSFRLNGSTHHPNFSEIALKAEKIYLLDRFEK